MQIQVETAELAALAARALKAPKATFDHAVKVVKAISFATEKKIKLEMPWDTGRARASWGHWTPSDLRLGAKSASASDAVWVVEDGGLTIRQGSNVGYIIYLNAGSSQKAPAGFIDQAQFHAQVTLKDELGLIDPLSAYA